MRTSRVGPGDSIAIASSSIRNGVLALTGYGVQVAVERGRLAVADGICDERRFGRLSRPTAGIKRLVVLGHTGFITFEALRWLRDVRASFVQIDADSQLIAAWGPVGLNDARLRRAQALASSNGAGIKIARELVRRKLEGQLALLDRLPDGQVAVGAIRGGLDRVDSAASPEQFRLLESVAAAAYWKVWEHIPVRFVRRDEPKVPDHWRMFGARTSPLSASPRLAANPANSILNYLYAMLESEARIAALAVGLDPGMGVLHADQPARDSLALDLIEAGRAEVDAYVLELLQKQLFRASDFFETRQGVCRMLPSLTSVLAATAPRWARRIAPVAEWVARMFASAPGSRVRQLPTPLTQAHRSAGRELVRRQELKEPRSPKPASIAACRVCGVMLPSPRRLYCDECRPMIRTEGLEAWTVSGPAALARLMAEGRDPTHGGEAGRKRATSLRRRQREAAEWEHRNSRPNPDEFRQRILPALRGVPLEKMARSTGLSVRYCSFIRRGLYVPHPRHWEVLGKLATL